MAKLPIKQAHTPSPARNVSRAEATNKLCEQKKIGEEIRDRKIRSDAELEAARAARKEWKDFVTLMLKKFLTTDELPQKFQYSSKGHYRMDPSAEEKAENHRDDMQASINELQSTVKRLALLDEPNDAAQRTGGAGEDY